MRAIYPGRDVRALAVYTANLAHFELAGERLDAALAGLAAAASGAGEGDERWRLQAMRLLPQSLMLRPRLMASLAAGAVLTVLLPGDWRWATRFLIVWDAGTIFYLGLLSATMFTESVDQISGAGRAAGRGGHRHPDHRLPRDDHEPRRHRGPAQRAQRRAPDQRGIHLALGGVTILCSWALLHAFFTLHYAGIYYRHGKAEPCLEFPGKTEPDYVDFLYFAYTIGCTSRDLRCRRDDARGARHRAGAFRPVLRLQHHRILALAINVGAGLVSAGS